MLLGVDVGGTFTDAVLFDGSVVHAAKAPTTPADQSTGVLAAVDAVLARAGRDAAEVSSFAHGMTVGTNALLEERGARTALVATAGFTDLLDVGRQNRPHLYRLCAPKPAPLAPAGLRFGARERVSAGGVVSPLEGAEADRLAADIGASGAESVAICLLFAYVEPAHEALLAEHLRAALPGVHVSASHEVLAQFREYERCSTTVIDAYLSPLLRTYLRGLTDTAAERGLPEPLVIKSSGGVAPAPEAAGAETVLSGPAGGAVGAGLLATLSGDGDALGIDMGGTSCDVCVIESGEVRRTDSREIGARVIQLPMVDVHTVGAGGGSIAWRDDGGALRVGPRSAGAEPGPACYGRGGTEPTVTDANLLLGRLAADAPLAGGVSLDPGTARDAVGALAEALGMELIEAAEGIVRVANQEMVRALRVVTVERGVDPRRFALLPFGGAGPLHATALADELGIDRILCPRSSGVLSALGLIATGRRRDTARTVMLRGPELTADRVAAEIDTLRESLEVGLADAEAQVTCELRYQGQAFEIAIATSEGPDPAELREEFAAEHERRYGYRDADAEIELVNVRLALAESRPEPRPTAAPDGALERQAREVRLDSEWVEAEILRGEPPAGAKAAGPCVFELPEATLVLPEGWAATVDDHGTIDARRSG
jgi:N-methylhydantoinase A